jgi:hypothetical protein
MICFPPYDLKFSTSSNITGMFYFRNLPKLYIQAIETFPFTVDALLCSFALAAYLYLVCGGTTKNLEQQSGGEMNAVHARACAVLFSK